MRIVIAILSAILLASSAPAHGPASERARSNEPAMRVLCQAAEVPIRLPSGRTVATMHAYAYHVADDPGRPVTFLWNGGPGAASALLHTMFAAPMTATMAGPEPEIELNPYALLDITDLVYVDPVGSGLSRATSSKDAPRFWNVDDDAIAAAEFVRTYLDDRGMLDRPVYLCGESYGAIRVAAMLGPLASRDIEVEGLILISPALESRTLRPSAAADRLTSRADQLTSLAAVALHREGWSAAAARGFLDEAYAFAQGPYRAAMDKGRAISHAEIEAMRAQRDAFTLGHSEFSVSMHDHYDARHPRSWNGESLAGINLDRLKAAHRELLTERFRMDIKDSYIYLNGRANSLWGGPDRTRRHFSATDIRVPDIIAEHSDRGAAPRVFIAGGWYDFVTPFGANRRLADRGAFGRALVTVRDYPGGHVIYADDQAHAALAEDLRDWWASQGHANAGATEPRAGSAVVAE
ncbi:MAG: hypothetical protein RLN60_03770 [Phycisphaerales bacterium]